MILNSAPASSFQVQEHEALRGIMKMARRKNCVTVLADWPKWHGPGKIVAEDSAGLCHELAHLAVAPPSRRDMKWVGLGSPGGVSSGFEGPTEVSGVKAIAEESEASLLGILMHRMVGGDYIYHFREHSWDSPKIAQKVMQRLKKKGLVERSELIQPDNTVKMCWLWTGKFWKEECEEG